MLITYVIGIREVCSNIGKVMPFCFFYYLVPPFKGNFRVFSSWGFIKLF